MSLTVENLSADMLAAFRATLAEKWPEIKEYANAESKKLAENLLLIQTLKSTGSIDEQQARLLLEIQRNASRAVLLAIEGMGLLAAEKAISDALSVVSDAVNTALGFPLL